MKCHRCGRIFVYYGTRNHPHCPNARCHTMVTMNTNTRLEIRFGTSAPRFWVPTLKANKAFIYLNSFNNELNINAEIYSSDGLNSTTIPLNTDKLKITSESMVSTVPEHNRRSTKNSEILITSGKYELSSALTTHIREQSKLLSQTPVMIPIQ